MGLSGQGAGQPSTKNGEWPAYTADIRGSRYSPLDQINAANFKKLEVAWRFKTDNLGTRPEFKLEGTPLMVKGVVYATAGTRRSVVALDGKTGELMWVHSLREGTRAGIAPRQLSGRGLSYWTDGRGDERVLYVTTGYRLVALNAKTGSPITSFGKDGIVDLKVGMVTGSGQQIDLETGEAGLHSTPTIVKDVVIVGSSFKEGMTVKTHNNTKGLVRAFDVRTGKLLWTFNTIPRPGEFGNDTWLNDSWKNNGNTGVWAQITVDEDLGLVYLPVESPTSDFYGGDRPGNNLFGESLVCVDLKTGQRKWHYQIVHHPIWDYDLSSAPLLADITVNGRAIKAVALPSKEAFLYVFDRVTGLPVWPIEERPVPKGSVPGEWYSPTQPFPTRPPAYARQAVTVDELIDFTPEMREQAIRNFRLYDTGPMFTPPALAKARRPARRPDGRDAQRRHQLAGRRLRSRAAHGVSSGLQCRARADRAGRTAQRVRVRYSICDGHGGGAVRGTRGTRVRQRRRCAAAPSSGAGRRPPLPRPPGVAPPDRPANPLVVEGLPLVKPPYGLLSAINLDRGELTWQVAHGDTPDNVRNHPLLKGLTIPKTGQSGAVGLVITKTLVVMGDPQVTTTADHPRGAMLRAYDKTTGKEVGAVWMPAPQSGSPMTYMLNGKQYIVVAVSGGNYSGEYIAFSVPDDARVTN